MHDHDRLYTCAENIKIICCSQAAQLYRTMRHKKTTFHQNMYFRTRKSSEKAETEKNTKIYSSSEVCIFQNGSM